MTCVSATAWAAAACEARQGQEADGGVLEGGRVMGRVGFAGVVSSESAAGFGGLRGLGRLRARRA